MREVKYWRAFNEAITEEMKRDKNTIYLAEDARGNWVDPSRWLKD